MFPEVGQGLHPMEIGVDNLQVLGTQGTVRAGSHGLYATINTLSSHLWINEHVSTPLKNGLWFCRRELWMKNLSRRLVRLSTAAVSNKTPQKENKKLQMMKDTAQAWTWTPPFNYFIKWPSEWLRLFGLNPNQRWDKAALCKSWQLTQLLTVCWCTLGHWQCVCVCVCPWCCCMQLLGGFCERPLEVNQRRDNRDCVLWPLQTHTQTTYNGQSVSWCSTAVIISLLKRLENSDHESWVFFGDIGGRNKNRTVYWHNWRIF